MSAYLLVKSVHLFCVMAWVAGMMCNSLVLFSARHVPGDKGDAGILRFHKWDKLVTNPAQGGAWLFGATMIVMGGWWPDVWLLVKLACVIAISAVHGMQSATLRKLTAGQDPKKRIVLIQRTNFIAIPLVLVIIILVVNKPI